MRRDNDERTQMLAQAMKQEQRGNQNDVEIFSVELNDQEFVIMEKRNEFQLMPTPDGILVPRTVGHTKYRLGEDGRSLKSISNAALCRFGHIVGSESIYTCSHCHSSVCRKDSIFSGAKVYCRKKPCSVYGRMHKGFRFIYIVIRFCVGAVLGLETPKPMAPQPNTVSEREQFPYPNREDIDLSEAEREADR